MYVLQTKTIYNVREPLKKLEKDMEGMSSEGMSAQAQQIWGMLDDMAENDPAAYR